MQLLHSSPTASPEFASLSILLSTNDSMIEPVVVFSTTSTISGLEALLVVEEMHNYVRCILSSATVSKGSAGSDDFVNEMMREDEKLLRYTQIYRPLAGHGLGLFYRVMKGQEAARLQSLVVASSVASTGKVPISSEIIGAVLSVGVTGLPIAYAGESTAYSMQQRMSDCVAYILQRNVDSLFAKRLMTTFLLSENDEYRINNERMQAPNLLVLPEESEEKVKAGVLSPMGIISPIVDFRKASSQRGGGRQGNIDGDDGAHDTNETGFPLSFDDNSAEASRTMTDRLLVLSVAENDTLLRKYEQSGQERKANLDLTSVSKSRFQRRRKVDGKDADFDNFDYKGPIKEQMQRTAHKAVPALQPQPESHATAGKLQLRSSRKDTKTKGSSSTKRLGLHMGDNHHRKGSIKHQFDDEASQDTEMRSHSGNNDERSILTQSRLQVNIAVNEDLTCSYKLSQLASCNVEGVVQLQVKSSTRSINIPLAMIVRDPSKHIQSFSENKKIADDVSSTQSGKEDPADLKFNLVIPRLDVYFPFLKYKCTGDLRPVPLRVQTKVKLEEGFCRVALQISSNPNNDGNLSDLTIVMGVSSKVKGDTIATQPPGGVWDEVKSSVVWCVSELGTGEKFQLQARFELMEASFSVDELSFPVLVRCQCLYVQLSDVEFETIDRQDVFPAEIATKVARRFRLSHRERN